MKQSEDIFRSIIQHAPLVSIDLLVERDGRYLLGLRKNAPAQGYWFLPGGRIFKNERLAEAFTRIAAAELGLSLSIDEAEFVVVGEHLYAESMFDADISTHYIVLTYRLTLPPGAQVILDDQHEQVTWLTAGEIRANPQVHENVKMLFPETDQAQS